MLSRELYVLVAKQPEMLAAHWMYTNALCRTLRLIVPTEFALARD